MGSNPTPSATKTRSFPVFVDSLRQCCDILEKLLAEFYENRTPELQLVNPDLNEDIYNLIEAAELDPEQEAKLERELSRQYHILTRDDRVETVAQDIVRHFLGRGFVGKAMVVSIDKATALKMHDKVRTHWGRSWRG